MLLKHIIFLDSIQVKVGLGRVKPPKSQITPTKIIRELHLMYKKLFSYLRTRDLAQSDDLILLMIDFHARKITPWCLDKTKMFTLLT